MSLEYKIPGTLTHEEFVTAMTTSQEIRRLVEEILPDIDSDEERRARELLDPVALVDSVSRKKRIRENVAYPFVSTEATEFVIVLRPKADSNSITLQIHSERVQLVEGQKGLLLEHFDFYPSRTMRRHGFLGPEDLTLEPEYATNEATPQELQTLKAELETLRP